jgi:hypothetical protein
LTPSKAIKHFLDDDSVHATTTKPPSPLHPSQKRNYDLSSHREKRKKQVHDENSVLPLSSQGSEYVQILKDDVSNTRISKPKRLGTSRLNKPTKPASLGKSTTLSKSRVANSAQTSQRLNMTTGYSKDKLVEASVSLQKSGGKRISKDKSQKDQKAVTIAHFAKPVRIFFTID